MLFQLLNVYRELWPGIKHGWQVREKRVWKEFKELVHEEYWLAKEDDADKLDDLEELGLDYISKDLQPTAFDLQSVIYEPDSDREIIDKRLFPDLFDLVDDEFFIDFLFFCLFLYLFVDIYFAFYVYFFYLFFWDALTYEDLGELDPSYDAEQEEDFSNLLFDDFSNSFFEFDFDDPSKSRFNDYYFFINFSSKSFKFFIKFNEKFKAFRRKI